MVLHRLITRECKMSEQEIESITAENNDVNLSENPLIDSDQPIDIGDDYIENQDSAYGDKIGDLSRLKQVEMNNDDAGKLPEEQLGGELDAEESIEVEVDDLILPDHPEPQPETTPQQDDTIEKEVPENIDNEESESIERNINNHLPLSKIKYIMKVDPDVTLCSSDAAFLITRATVSTNFISYLATFLAQP